MADVYRIPNAIILIRQTPQWICSNFFGGAQTCWGLFKAIRCFFSYTLVHGWERAPSSGAHVTAASFRHNTHAHVDTDSGEERKKKKNEHTRRRIIVYLHRMVGQTPTLIKKPLICFFFFCLLSGSCRFRFEARSTCVEEYRQLWRNPNVNADKRINLSNKNNQTAFW